MEERARPSWTRVVLAVIVIVEIGLVAGGFRLLSDAAYPWRTELESRPLTRSANVVVKRADVIDSLSVMYGNQVFGRDPLAAEDVGVPSFRSQLAYDPGHFSWVVLDEKVPVDGPLCTLALQGMRGTERRQLEASLTDGVLNFFYDLGGDEKTFVHNWSTVGVQELQMSPLLAWTKRVDFVALSSYDPAHCGALSYVLQGNPDLLVLGPPLPRTPDPQWGKAAASVLATAKSARRLRVLERGLHPLTPRLSMWVYEAAEGRCEAALVIRTGARLTVVAGAPGQGPARMIEGIERAGQGPVTAFVGATGLEIDDEAARADLDRLRGTHPELHFAPGFATSIEGLSLLSEVFGGGRIEPARLGTRIPLSRF